MSSTTYSVLVCTQQQVLHTNIEGATLKYMDNMKTIRKNASQCESACHSTGLNSGSQRLMVAKEFIQWEKALPLRSELEQQCARCPYYCSPARGAVPGKGMHAHLSAYAPPALPACLAHKAASHH